MKMTQPDGRTGRPLLDYSENPLYSESALLSEVAKRENAEAWWKDREKKVGELIKESLDARRRAEKAESELAELRPDAMRYRWIREHGNDVLVRSCSYPESRGAYYLPVTIALDITVDQAMTAATEGEK